MDVMNQQRHDDLNLLTAQLAERVRSAAEHGAKLGDQIQGWLKREPIKGTAAISDDRLSWELRVDVIEPAPFLRWASTFGDGVHNLRVALDNLAWGLAALDGAQPQKPKAIFFPIVEKRTDWAQQQKQIAELPASAKAAIESIQPFQRTGVDGLPETDGLLLLGRLDNTDKHRFAIQPMLTATEIEHSFSVEFGSDEDAAKNVPPDTTISTDVFVKDAVLLRHVTKTPIVAVKGNFAFKGQVVVIDPILGPLGVTTVLAQLATYVPRVMDHILNSVRS